MRLGGVTGWLRAAAIAGAAGMPISTYLYPELAAQMMRGQKLAHWLEWQDWVDPILQNPYETKMAYCISPMCLVSAWNGTKLLYRSTRHSAKSLKIEPCKEQILRLRLKNQNLQVLLPWMPCA
jgi:hypothetical protein